MITITIPRIILGLLATALAVSATPEKRRPHENLRERWKVQPDLERWFRPGELGYEAGATPAPLSERAFLTRTLGRLGGDEGKAWGVHNRLTPRLNFSHNLSRVFPPSLYDEHPEYFPEEAGKRIRPPAGAQWWQPDLGREDVAAYAAKQATKYFAEQPEAVSFALGINDGLNFGESPETTAWTMPVKWFRHRPDYSNLVFNFLNQVAAQVAPTNPDKYVGALAYYWAENVPDFPVNPHVIPFLTADRSQGYDPEFLQKDRELQKKWVEAMRNRIPETGKLKPDQGQKPEAVAANLTESNSSLRSQASGLKKDSSLRSHLSGFPEPPLRIGLYDYLYGSGFLIPRQHPHLLAEHLRYTRRLGFTDYFAEMNPNWGLDGPQPWLVAQLLQDPEQSVDGLLKEYYGRFFNSAAKPMRRFFSRCEEQWLNQSGKAYWLKFYRNESQAILFPPEVCRELRVYLDKAAEQADSDLVRARVKQVSDAFGVTERFVTMQFARERLNRAVLRGDADPDDVCTMLRDFRQARADFTVYTENLRSQQPLLIAPYKEDDYLAHDPTANTLLWLHRKLGAQSLPAIVTEDAEMFKLWLVLGNPRLPLLSNPTMSGEVSPARIIAGLPYSIALPNSWQSRVEPAEHFKAELSDGDQRTLQVSGSINTTFYQWLTWSGDAPVATGVEARGKVSDSAAVVLTLSWLDKDQQFIRFRRMRLPAGEWPDWVQLNMADLAPAGAAFLGMGITLNNQGSGDWLAFKGFYLEAIGSGSLTQ